MKAAGSECVIQFLNILEILVFIFTTLRHCISEANIVLFKLHSCRVYIQIYLCYILCFVFKTSTFVLLSYILNAGLIMEFYIAVTSSQVKYKNNVHRRLLELCILIWYMP